MVLTKWEWFPKLKTKGEITMSDFFDQDTNDFEDDYVNESDAPVITGARVLINGSYQPLEVGANFLETCKATALQAGFGKFRVLLNGEEVRPSSCPSTIEESHNVEIRPYDEAGC